jgi:hypothetical protein
MELRLRTDSYTFVQGLFVYGWNFHTNRKDKEMLSTMKKINILAVLTLVLLSLMFLSGCASKTVGEDKFSGFLGKQYYSSMEKIKLPSGAVSMNWTAPDFYSDESHKKYFDKTKLLIDRIVWHPAPKPGSQVRAQILTAIAEYWNENLIKQIKLNTDAIIVDKPGPGVMRISPALTGVEISAEKMKVYEVVPVAAVFAIGSVATGTRDRIVEVYLEAKGSDSLSGEMQIALVRKGIGTEKLENVREELQMKQAKPILDQFISDFVANLKLIKAGKQMGQ